MKVLHLANWYPSSSSPLNGIFIKDFVDNLQKSVFQKTVHISADQSDFKFQFISKKISDFESSFLLRSNLCRGRLVELFTLLLLVLTRVSLGRKWWDIVNIHIAYPIARYPRLLRVLFGKNLIITEHWSAYHYNFHLPANSKGKRRLQNIFHHGIPVIAVSNALAEDIKKFSNSDSFKTFIIPNIIQPEIFNIHCIPASSHIKTTFLMAATWANIKQPFLILKSFKKFHDSRHDVSLRIIGEGPQWTAMKEYVKQHGLDSCVIFLGWLSKPEIAREMQAADCFLHASKYETFSIVCAESLFCGTPVIASNLPAIRDFVDQENGLFTENTVADWYQALSRFMDIKGSFDRESISRRAIDRFHPDHVREQVLEAYRWTIEHEGGVLP